MALNNIAQQAQGANAANFSAPVTAAERAQRSVFVGNIPYEATEEQLKEIFLQAGPVVSFRLVYDRETGKPKGYGFCEYEDVETAQSAMRNLNNHDFNGRPLRVGVAAGEQSKDDKSMQQALGGPIFESPYGDPVDTEKAPEAISRAVASLPPEQMFELMKQMKLCIQNNPNEARNMLLQNPQLAYALLQAQIVMKIVDPQVAMAMLHRQTEAIPPVGTQKQEQPRETEMDVDSRVSAPAPAAMRPQASGAPASVSIPQSVQMSQAAPPSLMSQAGPTNLLSQAAQSFNAAPAASMAGGPSSASRVPPLLGDSPGGRGGPGPGMGQMGGPMGGPSPRQEMGGPSQRQEMGGPPQRQEMGGPVSGPRGNMGSVQGYPDRSPMERNMGMGGPQMGGPNEFRGMRPEMGGPNMQGQRGMGDMGGPMGGMRGQMRPEMRDPRHMGGPGMGGSPGQQGGPMGRMPGQSGGGGMGGPRPSLGGGAGPGGGQDTEKAALIMQVLQLSDEQIRMLPPDQRQSIMILKEQIARSGNVP